MFLCSTIGDFPQQFQSVYELFYIRQEYGYFSVKQSLYRVACHENTKLSDCDSALNDHLIQMHVALMFGNSCSTKSCKVMRLSLTNPTLENFLQLLVESKFSLWEYFWIIIAGMKTEQMIPPIRPGCNSLIPPTNEMGIYPVEVHRDVIV